MNDSKANAFRFAFSKGFVAYTQNGPLRAGSQAGSGGVAVLVRRGFPQKAKFSKDRCQGMFIWVHGVFFGLIYSAPHENSPRTACNGFLDALVTANVKPSNKWFVGGEFNETPEDGLQYLQTRSPYPFWWPKRSRFLLFRLCWRCWPSRRLLLSSVTIGFWKLLPVFRFLDPFGVSFPKGPNFLVRMIVQLMIGGTSCLPLGFRPKSNLVLITVSPGLEKVGSSQMGSISGRSAALFSDCSPVLGTKGALLKPDLRPCRLGAFLPICGRGSFALNWLSRLRTKYHTTDLSEGRRKELKQLCRRLCGSEAIPSRMRVQSETERLDIALRQS